MKPILVSGATGNVGLEVAKGLLEAGARLRAGVISPERARGLLGEAPEYVRLDFSDPSSFTAALAGVEQVFLLRPPQISQVEQTFKPFLQAAKAAGVKQVVFLSLLGAERNRVVPHRKIEDLILSLELPYVFLRASFFMQNLSTTHLEDIRTSRRIMVPAGSGKTSFIDARDIAAVALKALLEHHQNQAYDLTGSEALSYYQVAQIFSEVLGVPVGYANPSVLGFARYMRQRGFGWGFIGVMVGIYTTARLGLAGRVSPTVGKLLGREPITMRQFVQDYRELWLTKEQA